jgi:hypothetical protein
LDEPELVLEGGNLPCIGLDVASIEITGELEGVAKTLATDTQTVEVAEQSCAMSSSYCLPGLAVALLDQLRQHLERGQLGDRPSPERSLVEHRPEAGYQALVATRVECVEEGRPCSHMVPGEEGAKIVEGLAVGTSQLLGPRVQVGKLDVEISYGPEHAGKPPQLVM